MSSSPIAEHLERDMKGSEVDSEGAPADSPNMTNPDAYYPNRDGYPEPPSERDIQRNQSGNQMTSAPNTVFMPGLLDAQQKFITAQYQFMHDNNMAVYAAAQRDLIQYQMSVLNGMGVFG